MSHGRCVRSCYFALCLSLCFSIVLLRRVFPPFLCPVSCYIPRAYYFPIRSPYFVCHCVLALSCLGGYSRLVSCSGGYSRRFFVLSPTVFRGHTTFPFNPLLCLSLCFSAVLLRRVFRLVSCSGGYSRRFFVLSPAIFRGHTTFPFEPPTLFVIVF